MFWIGLIVGAIIGVVAWVVYCVAYCAKRFGTMDNFMGGVNMMQVAADNRESTLQVYHEGELLDEVVFEEL